MTQWYYIAARPCGCIVGAVVDDPELRKEVARAVKDWIEADFVVTRADSAYVQGNLATDRCPHRAAQLALSPAVDGE